MLDWTDRHERYFLRLCSPHALLYTEMVTTGALLHGDAARYLAFHPAEHPVALQLGGSDPAQMAASARLGQDAGFDEININVGCPSDRVQNGAFGACLMLQPAQVADCIAAIRQHVTIPITVKSRIGVDDQDSYELLAAFTAVIRSAGCDALIVHARKAWLQGLSPKQNREIPPLRYAEVYRLKSEFPDLPITINGGIRSIADVDRHLEWVDGVMLGREVYHNPYRLAELEQHLFGTPAPGRMEILEGFLPYLSAQLAAGTALQGISRHLLGLFQGLPGARSWRRAISEQAHRASAGAELLREAARRVQCAEQPESPP